MFLQWISEVDQQKVLMSFIFQEVEEFQGPGVIFDDTALNGIRLLCVNSNGTSQMTYVESELGQ